MKRQIISCILLCIYMLFTLTSCWSRRELNTLAISQSIGIDKTEDGKFMLTIQILKPSEIRGPSSGGGTSGGDGGIAGKSVWTLTTTGNTIQDALKNATYKSDRRLLTSFINTLVIGEDLARDGINGTLDHFTRDYENRLLINLFIAHGKAKDIIESVSEQEKIPGRAMKNFMQATGSTSKITSTNLNELFKLLTSKTSQPVVPGITFYNKQVGGREEKLLLIDDLAIFKKDVLIGWFTKSETRGLLWITGKVKSGVIAFKSPKDEINTVGIEITRENTEIKPSIVDGKPVITVKVTEEGNLEEQLSYVDFAKPENFEELEKRQKKVIEEEIYTALNKAQNEFGVDIFKFGEAFHRDYPKQWKKLQKNWDTEFRNLKVNVKVEAKVRRLGLKLTPEVQQ